MSTDTQTAVQIQTSSEASSAGSAGGFQARPPQLTGGGRRGGATSLSPTLVDAEALEPRVELGPGDPELRGGVRLVPLRAPEGVEDRPLLKLREVPAFERRLRRRRPWFAAARWSKGEVGRSEERAVRHDQRPLDRVPELADVARPRVGQEQVPRVAAEPSLALAHALAECLREVARQEQDVVAALPELGQSDREDVD